MIQKWFTGEDQKLGGLKETSCFGWTNFHAVMIFQSFAIGIPKKFRKIFSVALHSYYIHLSLLTISFISVSIYGNFSSFLFPQQCFIKPQETLCRDLEMDVLSQVGNNGGKKIVVCIRIAEGGQNRTQVILLSPTWPCCPCSPVPAWSSTGSASWEFTVKDTSVKRRTVLSSLRAKRHYLFRFPSTASTSLLFTAF